MSILLKNGTIYPITSESFVGDILMNKGKIERIGQGLEEPGAEVIDVSGKYVFPGFIDAHSHIGIYEEGVGATMVTETKRRIPLPRMSPLSMRSIPRTQQ
jgi:dihydroorotase-like cyclic amidohydrolase